MGKPLVLELDHIDGNNQNDQRHNLRYLCPNCHSQTPTFRGKNITIKPKSEQVSDSDLLEALENEENISQALKKVGLVSRGGNYTRAKILLDRFKGSSPPAPTNSS